ncbi:MAG: VWA domain-containing protein [Anaerolineae bacterium]|nr:VWA domain-containing protein [Anaerolineae bacterium]
MKVPRKSASFRQDDESARLAARLVGCVPSATIEMETLCRLAGVKVSRAIPTAAVECLRRPRLLINPDFAAKYCQRDQHLFLLVMHELWHIILAHTRLYPRVTPAHNVAFDAIINAGLARQYYGTPEFRGFFEALNPEDKFPSMLLRPPVGWPQNPVYPDGGPAGTRQILERLYPRGNVRNASMPFYEEILQLLRQYAEENGWVWVEGEPVLLGDHSNPDAEAAVFADPLLSDTMRRVASRMPSQLGGHKPGRGGTANDQTTEVTVTPEHTRRAFSNVLRRCLGPRMGGERRRQRTPVPSPGGTSVLPNPRDRLSPARRRLGMPATIWVQPSTVKARVPEVPRKANVYLDVSGSMAQVLPHLLGLILPYVAAGQADIFQFSTVVEPLPLARLQSGRLRTTGGTDINCVMRHVLEQKPQVPKVLLLTDGAVGALASELFERVRDQNLRIYVVLPAEAAWEDDLRPIATYMTILPPLWGVQHPLGL